MYDVTKGQSSKYIKVRKAVKNLETKICCIRHVRKLTMEANDLSAKTYIILGLKLGDGTGKPLQYSCLENPMDGGAW